MELLAERGRRISVDELNTTRLLAHARQQAVQRKLDDVLIVDVDAHHYENEYMSDILSYMPNDVLRQVTTGGLAAAPRHLSEQCRFNTGHGRARDALSVAQHGDDSGGTAPRHPAWRALDGRD